ncbi:MAG: cysteine desulfurase family protein [bacterium]
MSAPVYLDHNATTPIDESVLEAMLPFLRRQHGNASSRHEMGTVARRAVDRAREQVAAAVGARPSQVVFTSGGTEANNLFIKGAAAMLQPQQIVVSAIDHPCVAMPARDLVRAGWTLHRLAVDAAGVADLDDLDAALRLPTGIVSTMLATNETGVLQPVAAIAMRARAARAWMHSDAVQALGKVPVDFEALGVHGLTVSAHKLRGPKGAGALVLDKRIELKPLLHGGGHESGMRSGTENVPAIVGFGVSCDLAVARLAAFEAHCTALRDELDARLLAAGATVFGRSAPRVPNTTCFAIDGIDGETLVIELDRLGFCVASGSACSSRSTEPSATLLAMGVSPDLARGAVRVSLGPDNDAQQMHDFAAAVAATADRLRRLTAMAV